MSQRKLNRSTLSMALVITVLALFQGIQVASNARPLAAAKGAVASLDLRSDLSTQVRILEAYHDELTAYYQQCAQLNKTTSVTRAEYDSLKIKADTLKSRLTTVQNAVSEVIRKLKAANAWNDLDEKLLESTTEEGLRTLFQESSFRQDLEEAAAGLGSRTGDITNPIDRLRSKLTARAFSPDKGDSVDRIASARAFSPGVYLVRAAYRPAAPIEFVNLACSVGRMRIKLIKRLGGIATTQTNHNVHCACHPDESIDQFILPGTPCN